MVHYYGFECPPWGILKIIDQLDIPHSTFYILDPFTNHELPYNEIQSLDKKNLFVVIHTHEGASHHWFDRLIPKLNLECGVPLKQIVIHSSCLRDPDSPVGHIGSVVAYTSEIVSRYPELTQVNQYPTHHHFVCLNRVERWQRLKLVKLLIDRGLCDYGKISYTASVADSDPYRQHFPMVVDYTTVSYDQGHEIVPAMVHALVNVITESCYEMQPGHDRYESHPMPGLTEKTYKSIMFGQIPIFVASQHTVKCYRNLGFDAFDDIVDHSYDLTADPVDRIYQIVDQIERITKITEIGQLRQQLMPRFQKNFDLLKWYSYNWSAEQPKWIEYFKQLTQG